MQQTYNLGGRIDVICFTAKHGVKVSEIQPKMEQVIKAAHYISPDDKQAVMCLNAEAMFSMVDNLFTGINILVWMVGLGTLLAGAIGVSNIMMVTVKERTTEIGIRRAIGARPKDILQQILSESMVLTTIAGMCGISFAVMVLQLVEMGANADGGDTRFQVTFGLAIGTCALLIALECWQDWHLLTGPWLSNRLRRFGMNKEVEQLSGYVRSLVSIINRK